jgi:hypothetical protein
MSLRLAHTARTCLDALHSVSSALASFPARADVKIKKDKSFTKFKLRLSRVSARQDWRSAATRAQGAIASTTILRLLQRHEPTDLHRHIESASHPLNRSDHTRRILLLRRRRHHADAMICDIVRLWIRMLNASSCRCCLSRFSVPVHPQGDGSAEG